MRAPGYDKIPFLLKEEPGASENGSAGKIGNCEGRYWFRFRFRVEGEDEDAGGVVGW